MLKGIIVPASESKIINFNKKALKSAICPEKWEKDIKELGEFSLECTGAAHLPFPFEYYTASDHDDSDCIFVFYECSSVMDLVPEFKKKELLGTWGSVISIYQSGGRGRFGRKWGSAPGNLHAAILVPDLPEEFSMLEGMIVSVIIIEYLRNSGIKAMLKWPNDIVLENRKIAGVLVEKKQCGCIAGIGINLVSSPSDSDMRDGFLFPAGTVPGINTGPLKIWLDIAGLLRNRTHEIVYSMKLPGFISVVDEMLLWKGETVSVSDTSEGEITGEIIGTGKKGGLRILESGREKEIFSGTVIRTNNK